MSKTFTITRKRASEMLWVSTRTIDRYIKSGKLSYKKIANKILLSTDELSNLQADYQSLHQQSTVDIVRKATQPKTTTKTLSTNNIETIIDNKMNTFLWTLNEKDKVIEDKNKMIFVLQQRIGELEAKLQSMIALPEYNSQKQTTMLEKQRLESKIFLLQDNLKREKNKSLLFLWVVVVIILMYLIITKVS